VYDDEKFLYALEYNGNGSFQIDKGLKETPNYLDKVQSASIFNAIKLRSKLTMPQSGLLLERREDQLYYQGIELLSLAPYFQKNKDYAALQPQQSVDLQGIGYDANFVKINDHMSLISIRVFYETFVPPPYTPYEQMTFLIKDGESTKLDGFTQSIDGFYTNDGGIWVWSGSPHEISARNAKQRGQVMWVGIDGKVNVYNDLLGAQNIAMLQPLGHEAIVCAYTLAGMDPMKEGYYRLLDDGTYKKMADVIHPFDMDGNQLPNFQPAYADANRNLYT